MPSFLIRGPEGPIPAKRPSQDVLDELCSPDVSLHDRNVLAAALARKGYTLDTCIDIWGWDFEKTMAQRRLYGYKWIPAVGQPVVQIAPGLSMPGLNPYDADNAPLGAILVPEE